MTSPPHPAYNKLLDLLHLRTFQLRGRSMDVVPRNPNPHHSITHHI